MSQATRLSDSTQDFFARMWYTWRVTLWHIGLTVLLLAVASIGVFVFFDARRPPE